MKVSFNNNYHSTANINTNKNISFQRKIDYGVTEYLPETLQIKVSGIHENINFIKSFFDSFKKTRAFYASIIKKQYPNLVQRKDSGYTFVMNDGLSISVMQGQSKKNLLWIQINDGSKFNGIVLDGNDKLVANVSPNHPHMLPRELKYMNKENVKKANPAKFIDIIAEKISDYAEYINQVKSGDTEIDNLYRQSIQKINARRNKTGIKRPRKKPSEIKTKSIDIKNLRRVYNDTFVVEFNNHLKNLFRHFSGLDT